MKPTEHTDTWFVEYYNENQQRWIICPLETKQKWTPGPFPSEQAVACMLREYRRWKNNYSVYHMRLRHAVTNEIIPREVFDG